MNISSGKADIRRQMRENQSFAKQHAARVAEQVRVDVEIETAEHVLACNMSLASTIATLWLNKMGMVIVSAELLRREGLL
jgi:ribosomal protein S11